MLIIFLMGLGARGYNVQWLSHELDHESFTNITALDDHDLLEQQHEHPPAFDASSDSREVPLTDIDHRLLHAVNDVPVFMVVTIARFEQAPLDTLVLSASLISFPTVDQTPPFHPPRSISLLA